jgi:RES domain
MAKLPPPPEPSVLAVRTPAEVVAVTRVTGLWRVYRASGPHAARWDRFRHFGPVATSRFDHHLSPPTDQDRGILYAAVAIRTCVAEVFGDTRVIDRRRRDPWIVGFGLAREVSLLDLSGAWPTRAGASQAINSGPRDAAREWARAIYAAYPEVEGLWYRSSMDGGRPAISLNERAEHALLAQPQVHMPLSHPGLELPLARMGRTLGYLLV